MLEAVHCGKAHSLLGAAVATLPAMAVVPPPAAVAGVGIAIAKRFMPFNLVAWIILPVGLGLFSTLDRTSSQGAKIGYQAFVAIGGSIGFSGRLLAVQTPQKRLEDIPMTKTLVSFFTSLGQSFGLAIGGTIFQNDRTKNVNKQIASGRLQAADLILSRNVEDSALLIRKLLDDVQAVYAHIVSESLRLLWITLAALATSAFLVTLLQKNLSITTAVQKIEQLKDQDNSHDLEQSEKHQSPTDVIVEEVKHVKDDLS